MICGRSRSPPCTGELLLDHVQSRTGSPSGAERHVHEAGAAASARRAEEADAEPCPDALLRSGRNVPMTKVLLPRADHSQVRDDGRERVVRDPRARSEILEISVLLPASGTNDRDVGQQLGAEGSASVPLQGGRSLAARRGWWSVRETGVAPPAPPPFRGRNLSPRREIGQDGTDARPRRGRPVPTGP